MEGELRSDMEANNINMSENWLKWNPIDIPKGEYIVTSFTQDKNGVKILLDDEKHAVEVFFDGVPLLIRQAMEGIRMRTWGEIQDKYHDKSYFRHHFFFLVKNSLLTEWAVEEGAGFYEREEISHYCIVTSEELIDILATFEPEIKVTSV